MDRCKYAPIFVLSNKKRGGNSINAAKIKMKKTWNQFRGEWETENNPFFTTEKEFIEKTVPGDSLVIAKEKAHNLKTTGKTCRDGLGILTEQVILEVNGEKHLCDIHYNVQSAITIQRGSDL